MRCRVLGLVDIQTYMFIYVSDVRAGAQSEHRLDPRETYRNKKGVLFGLRDFIREPEP